MTKHDSAKANRSSRSAYCWLLLWREIEALIGVIQKQAPSRPEYILKFVSRRQHAGLKKQDDPGVAVKMDGTIQAQMQTGDSELVFRWGGAFDASRTTADTPAL